MTYLANIPLFCTPPTTNSGILNIYGPIYHPGPVDSVEIHTISYTHNSYDNYNYGLWAPSNRLVSLPFAFSTPINENITKFEEPTTYSGIVYSLGFIYTIEVGGTRKDSSDIFINIKGISRNNTDFEAVLRPNNTSITDVATLTRVISKAEDSIEASFTYVAANKIHQIFSKDEYVYAAIGKGLAVYDMNTEAVLATLEIPNTVSKTIWGNETTLYLGNSFGLFEIDYVTLHANYSNITLKESTFIENKNINYVHGYRNKVLVCTASGIEFYDYSGNPHYKSKIDLENTFKCFMTSDKAYYLNYTTVSGENTYYINRQDFLATNWSAPTKNYYTGGDILKSDIYLTDIFITEQTARNGGNTIFCTTSSGVYVIDEDSWEYAIYYNKII